MSRITKEYGEATSEAQKAWFQPQALTGYVLVLLDLH